MSFIDPYPAHLLHPELRDKTRGYIVQRTSMWSKWWYPVGEQIGWFGSVIRDTDGGLGMYCTLDQFEAWPHKVKSDHRAGPA